MPTKTAIWALVTVAALAYMGTAVWRTNEALSQLSQETQAVREDIRMIKQELAIVLSPEVVKRLVADEEKAREISARLAGLAEDEVAKGAARVGTTAAKTEGTVTQKAVYHVDSEDPEEQSSALRNIQNHLNAVGKGNVDIQVVLDRGGVTLLERALKEPEIAKKIASLKSQGVTFHVAADTLRDRELDYRTDLYDVRAEDIVPSGIAAIAQLEQQGYAYIKP
jgi:intracellular sulfur oxidation DsrE/DsrF family protein